MLYSKLSIFITQNQTITDMASVNVVQRSNFKKPDGTAPIAIRVTVDRKTRYVFTGQYLLPVHWDQKKKQVRSSHPNSIRLNNYFGKLVTEASKALLEAEVLGKPLSAKELQAKIKGKSSGSTFFNLASERIKEKEKTGVFSVSKAEESIVKNIERFHGSKNLSFEDIDMAWINKFKVFCLSELGHKPRTVTNQLLFIRTMWNRAIKENIAQSSKYPFGGDLEKIRIQDGEKIGLSRAEVQRIEELSLKSGTGIWHTKNIWLFSFYLAGVRISDVLKLKWTDIQEDRLYYTMSKNNKSLSLKLPTKASAILELYREPSDKFGYIFPDLKQSDGSKEDIFRKCRTATKRFNKHLKVIAEKCEITKSLSNHISRHTFGNIAAGDVHPQVLQHLYRHSDLKTTIQYQNNFLNEELDKGLELVVN